MNTLNPAFLPRVSEPLVGQGGLVTKAWENFFLRLASAQNSDDLRQLYEALAARVAELEDGQAASFQLFGQQSVVVQGTPADGVVFLTLQGDESSPGVTEYYGTGPTGTKGWFPVSGTITVNGSELTKTVGADGIVMLGLADVADSGVGAALVKITRDTKGRVSGTQPATTDDLPAGSTNKYFPEAPTDGQQYARQSGAWAVVTASGGAPKFPFILQTGASYIPLTGANELPFFLANGMASNIPVTP